MDTTAAQTRVNTAFQSFLDETPARCLADSIALMDGPSGATPIDINTRGSTLRAFP